MRVLNRTATRATGARVTPRRLGAFVAVAATAAALSVTSAPLADAIPAVLDKPTLQTATFTSTASVVSWTAPGDASTTVELMISAVGGQGGRGGYDGGTVPAPGGYVGVVSGTISVPGGTTLQIAVGAGGAGGANSATSGAGGNGGTNKFGGYAGGKGGMTGYSGTSGAGGGGGAATVIKVSGSTIVAAGAGGGGGSGNGGVLTGRAAEAAFSADHASGSTNGTAGQGVPNPSGQPDGGGAGGGGGGATGGSGGTIEYGSGISMEWFGYGGYPGANAAGGYGTLDGSYQYYSGNGANGSVTIRYVDGPPAAAQNVVGRPGTAEGSVELSWQAPVNSGLTAVTGYQVQYSANGGSTWSDATLAGAATVTADGGTATVTGLVGAADYVFRVAAENGYGQGGWSVPSAAVTAAAGGGEAPESPWGEGGDAGGTGAENAHVVPGDGTITVTWEDGTAPNDYTVHVYDEQGDEAGNSPRACGDGDCTVSGLDPEGDYTVVIETPGAETDRSDDIAPYQEDPNVQQPSGWNGAEVTRNSDNTSITVDWPAPATAPTEPYHLHVYDENGDELLSGSPVSCDAGSSCTVSGLEIGTTYQIAMDVPVVDAGEGDDPVEGTLTDKVTVPGYTTPPPNTHPAPDTWDSTPGEAAEITRNQDGTITVAPSPLPGDPYLLHVYDEDGEVAGSPFPCTGGSTCATGYLDPATSYEVTIEVPNRSAPSPEVTPSTSQIWTDPQDPARVLTGPPTNLGSTARDRALAVSFTAPAAQPAGNAILYYQYSLDGGGTWANSGAFASPANVSGLTNGTQYSVMLRAMTLEGEGVASTVVTGTPRSYPSAPYSGGNPAGIAAEKSGSTVTVSWAPYHANGSAITSYTVTAFNAASAGSAVKTCTVGGSTYTCQLTGVSGTVYLSVQAQNGVGASPRSDPRITLDMSATIPGAPGKPAVSGGSLTWTTPSGVMGSTAYTVQYSTDGGTTWTTVVPSSGPATSGSTVTAGIAGLAGGADYVFRARAQNGALVGPWSDQSDAVAIAAPATPEFGSVTRAPGGYTVQITNYDDALTWSVSAAPGTATIDGDGLVTVTGLAASQSATVTVTATGFGTGGRSASTSGTALGGTAPILSAATPIDKGFTVQIVNWSTYTSLKYGPHTVFTPVPAPVGGVPQYSGPDSKGLITVSGLDDGATLTFALKVKSDTHTETQSDGVVGKSLLAPVNPTFSTVTPTSDGFTASLTNFDSSGKTSYTLTVDQGTVAGPDGSGTITVSGLAAGASATVTVTAQEDGHAIGTGTQSGTALVAGAAPILGTPTRLGGGFTTSVTIPDGYSGATLSVMVSGGATVQCGPGAAKPNGPVSCASGDTITVSGVASGKTATVTAYLWDSSHGVVSGSQTGQALYAGVAPEFANYTRTDIGFTVKIANWDTFEGSDDDHGSGNSNTPGYQKSATAVTVAVTGVSGSDPGVYCDGDPADPGTTATCAVSSTVRVVGLSTEQLANLTVTVTDDNHTAASATMIGQANKFDEHFSDYAQAEDGYTVRISDYDDTNYSYAIEVTGDVPAGATVKCGGSGVEWTSDGPVVCANKDIIVAGLAAGEGATVEVAATVQEEAEDGLTNWISSFDGSALSGGVSFGFDDVRRTDGGFETAITEGTYDPSGDTAYSITVTDSDGHEINDAQASLHGRFITVSGLGAGVEATVTVIATKDGHVPTEREVTGAAKFAGGPPTFTGGARLSGGFTVMVEQPVDAGVAYSNASIIVMVDSGATVQCGAGGGDKGPRPNGPVVCETGETIAVSNVAPGREVVVTAAVFDDAHREVAASFTGQAQFAGVAPEFGPVTRTETGFTTSISNWATFKDSSLTATGTSAYVASDTAVTVTTSAGTVTCAPADDPTAGANSTASCSGAKITVAGLASDQTATVTVTVTESDGNHTDSAAARQGQALATGTSPEFDAATSLVKSFSVRIENYDAASSYTITATEGDSGSGTAIPAKNVSFNSGTQLITVTGLADGAQATVRVQVAAAGKLPAEASHIGTALKAPVTPVLAVVSNNASGFTVRIVNWDAFSVENYGSGTTFVPAATPLDGDSAPAVTDNHGGTFTVSGVPTGHTATFAVTVKQAEHPDATSDPITGTALYAGVAPTLGSPTRTADGFRVPITNYALYTAAGDPTVGGDDGSKYGDGGQFAITVTAVSPGGTALGDVKTIVLQPEGVLQVSGLAYGQTATVKLTAGDGLTKHQDATSDPAEGQALFAAIKASFGQVTATLDSITVRIANFDSDAHYAISSSAGVASRSGSVITVAGLAPGQDATITVVATTPGHVQGISSVSGAALKVQDQPGSSSATQREGGFSAKITPFDKDASYTAAVSGAPGARVAVAGDTVTVTGMKPGDTVTVTITQTKDGFAPVTTTITYTLPADAGTDQDPSGGATPPEVPELKPGQTSVTVNGVPVPSQTSVGPNGVTVTWQGMTMTAVQVVGGKPVPPGTGGSDDDLLTVPFTGSVKVDVSGFAPGSRVQLWAFSTPTLLGTFTSQLDARGIITVDLPMAVIVGDHTLVASGVNRAGEHVTMSTAMRVTPLAGEPGTADPDATAGREEIAYTGTHTFDELRIAAGLLVVGLGLVALSYRRRRPDPALALVGVAGGFGPEPESSGRAVVASGSWRRSPDSGAAAAAVTAAMTAMPSSVDTASAGVAGLLDRAAPADSAAAPTSVPVLQAATDAAVALPVQRAVDAAAAGGAPAPAVEPLMAPLSARSVEWMSLRFSLGLTEK